MMLDNLTSNYSYNVWLCMQNWLLIVFAGFDSMVVRHLKQAPRHMIVVPVHFNNVETYRETCADLPNLGTSLYFQSRIARSN